MNGRLEDRVALITRHGSSGNRPCLGVAFFCRRRAGGGGGYRRWGAGESGRRGPRARGPLTFKADVSCAADVERMIQFAESRRWGLCTCSSTTPASSLTRRLGRRTQRGGLRPGHHVNLKSVFLGCKHGIPALLRAGGGSIINTASFVAVMGAGDVAESPTPRQGGRPGTDAEIAVEFARRGIRANALCPGPVNTPLLQGIARRSGRRGPPHGHLPMGRLAEPEEIANAALFLASDDARSINGATFLVDGGTTRLTSPRSRV